MAEDTIKFHNQMAISNSDSIHATASSHLYPNIAALFAQLDENSAALLEWRDFIQRAPHYSNSTTSLE